MTKKLDELRDELNVVDARIVESLARRQQIVSEVAASKMIGTDALLDVEREKEILSRLSQMAAEKKLDPYFVTRIFREILDHSVRRQEASFVFAGFLSPPVPVGHPSNPTHDPSLWRGLLPR